MSDPNQPTDITFEAGYERLKLIAERIDLEEVPVSEMCDLFAEAKGLERALTEHLDTQKARLEKIERGDGVQAFRIVATPQDETSSPRVDIPIDDADFQPVTAASSPSASADDDVPF